MKKWACRLRNSFSLSLFFWLCLELGVGMEWIGLEGRDKIYWELLNSTFKTFILEEKDIFSLTMQLMLCSIHRKP